MHDRPQAKEAAESAFLGEREELYTRLTNANETSETLKSKVGDLEKQVERAQLETRTLKATMDHYQNTIGTVEHEKVKLEDQLTVCTSPRCCNLASPS